MAENKRFIFHKYDGEIEDTKTQEFHEVDKYRFDYMIVEKLNALAEENKELENENRMLKTIIGKNEQYIGNITHKGKWR